MAAKTTTKVATLTGAAKDDIFNLSEGNGLYALNVLANDPGAAKLYSVAQESGSSSAQFPVAYSAQLPSGATVAIVDGQLVYANDNVQSLPAGELLTETFSYTVRMANGALSTATVTLEIVGENDAASISGSNSASLNEDGDVLVAGGTLSVADVDRGENRLASVDADALKGAYGVFTLDSESGQWTYALDNALAQALNSGDVAYDELTVTSLDGTASETIRVAIHGADEPTLPDAPVTDGDNLLDPQDKFVINHGLTAINKQYVINGFDANDQLSVAKNMTYQGMSSYDYLNDQVQDTLISFAYKSGQQVETLEVVLVGYSDFNPETQIA